ncbi:MAG TPA: LysM peptidoglycan-binding domain-containing protein [Candidatus Eisenbacteria bacterium]|nr:LysM peptidoglycan-binding domain-containing protein [Candidatus Eisenbacteria bacterium]
MRFLWYPVAPALLLALLLGTGCEPSQPKNTAAKVPPQATAPTEKPPNAPASSPQVSPAPVSVAPNPSDPAEALIARVEKLYNAGQANYQAGHLDAARQNFDQAFNALLSSNIPVRDNPRLEHEFDKIVDGIRDLEIVALREGDGFTEQHSEPAPIDEANDVTFPVDPAIRAKAETEIKTTKSDLPLMLNDQVAMFINYFSSTKGRLTLEHGLARAGRYHDMISQTLKQEGVPQDLIYLAMAESGFQPLAVSRAGARGMWQFMAGRGSEYGLDRNWWVDERQDPVKSTQAAARHLKDLYQEFGDWYLAMAAYNTGPGNVQHAVERTGYADFWELYRRGVLPQETRNYVPIIVAVTIMAKNPVQYGLENVVPEQPVPTDQVTINYPVDLRLVAECLDTSASTLQQLNPSLLRMTTPKDQSFTLNLPAGTKDKYETAIALIPPDMRTFWRYHRVEYGESLASIARKYRTSAGVIEEANSLSGEEVTVGSKLIIPIAPGQSGDTVAYSRKATRYKVRKGDTLGSIADDFEVPVEKLRKWNHLRGNTVAVGRTLTIYKPLAEGGGPAVASSGDDPPSSKSGKKGKATTSAKSRSKTATGSHTATYHKVKKGETLSGIARSYNTTVANLKKNNANLSADLRPGDILVIRK